MPVNNRRDQKGSIKGILQHTKSAEELASRLSALNSKVNALRALYEVPEIGFAPQLHTSRETEESRAAGLAEQKKGALNYRHAPEPGEQERRTAEEKGLMTPLTSWMDSFRGLLAKQLNFLKMPSGYLLMLRRMEGEMRKDAAHYDGVLTALEVKIEADMKKYEVLLAKLRATRGASASCGEFAPVPQQCIKYAKTGKSERMTKTEASTKALSVAKSPIVRETLSGLKTSVPVRVIPTGSKRGTKTSARKGK